jgi:exopolyphosphatase/guanosine-5'-triphosphate,3'-diphosphate pyrophosphatase
MRVAIVDQGTNSTRLLLAEVVDGGVCVSRRFTTVTRLGQGVDKLRRLDREAMARVRTVVAGFATEIAAYHPERSLLVATSVLRDARGGQTFLEELRQSFNLRWRVIDGQEEAELSFRAVAAAFPDLSGRVVVIDIGGGSTEFAIGAASESEPATSGDRAGVPPMAAVATPAVAGLLRPSWSRSLDVGVVRLTERFFASDPPSEGQWQTATAFVRAQLLAGVPVGERTVESAVGVAGTFTTLVAHKLRLQTYDPVRVNGHLLALSDIEAAQALFRDLTSAQRGELPGIQPGREDVILAGALLAAEVCRLFGLDGIRVSEADLLEGAALWLAEQPWPASAKT